MKAPLEINRHTFNAAWNCPRQVESVADCKRISEVAAKSFGIEMSLGQANEVWECYSGHRCAQWLRVDMDSDEAIKDAITEFVKYRLEVE